MKSTSWKKWFIILMFISCLPLTVHAFTEQPPNQDLTQSTAISFSNQQSVIEGYFKSAADVDTYRFTLPVDGYLDIEAITSGQHEYLLTIYNANQNVLLSVSTARLASSGYTPFLEYGLGKGDYYIKVSSHSGTFPTANYKFLLAHVPSDSHERETNDTMRDANEIQLHKNYYGWVQQSGSDFYKFMLSESGELKIDFSYSPDISYRLGLRDASGRLVKEWKTEAGKGGDYPTIQTGLRAGAYYLEVGYNTYTGKLNKYNFRVNFLPTSGIELEPNNVQAEASPIFTGSTVRGFDESVEDIDYFVWQVTEKGRYVLDTSMNKEATHTFSVYGAQGQIMKSYASYLVAHNNRQRAVIDLDAGTHYVQVKRKEGTQKNIPYQFTVRKLPVPLTSVSESVGLPYADYKPYQYWSNHMLWAIQQGIIEGYPNVENQVTGKTENLIRPQYLLTEAQFLAVLYRHLEPDRIRSNVSTNPSYWANIYYQLAQQDQLPTVATLGNLNKANQPITRGRMAQIFASKHVGTRLTEEQSVQFMYDADLTDGYLDSAGKTPRTYTSYRADNELQRAHIVTFLKRYADFMQR